jgi:zona occludens toxin
MLKLVTGLPGAGKTSNELWDFLTAKEYEGRPKYATPIKGFIPANHGVLPLDHVDQWRELPEGSVIICDEVQRYCGTELGTNPPDWVKDLSIHRHSGKDLIFITQAPGLLHPFARKLVQPHVNYHRPYNASRVMRYSWESVQSDPASKTARNTGQSSMVKTNPKVFELYTSTVLDTHKARLPMKSLIILGIALLIAVVGIGFGVKFILGLQHKEAQVEPVTAAAVVHASAAPVGKPPTQPGDQKPVWTEETVKPRIPGQPYTAPVYDQLTTPTDFPRVAACMSSESRGTCNCYTQQATPVDVPASACQVFIKHGSFDPWLSGRKQQIAQAPAADSRENQVHPAVPSTPKNTGASYTVVADTSPLFTKTKDAITGRP